MKKVRDRMSRNYNNRYIQIGNVYMGNFFLYVVERTTKPSLKMSNSVPAEKHKALSMVLKEVGCTLQNLYSLAEMQVLTSAHSQNRSHPEIEEP